MLADTPKSQRRMPACACLQLLSVHALTMTDMSRCLRYCHVRDYSEDNARRADRNTAAPCSRGSFHFGVNAAVLPWGHR